MKKNKIYPAACIVLAVGIAAAAGLYGVTAWRAACDQESQIAYLRSLAWDVPLTEHRSVTLSADQLFGSCIGEAKLTERARSCATMLGFLKPEAWSVCGKGHEYFGDQQEPVFERQSSNGLTMYLDQDGTVLFRQKNLSTAVSCLSDTYVVTFDTAMNWSLADMEGNILYTGEAGRKIKGIDNRYAALAKNQVYDMETGKTRKLSGSYEEIKACDDGSYPYAAIRAAGGSAHMVYLDQDLEPVWDQNMMEDSYWYGMFGEGLIYGVKDADGKDSSASRGYFDQAGNLIVETANAKYASRFSEGKGIVYASGQRVYCVDRDGRILFEKQISKDPAWEMYNISWKSAFHDDRAVIFDGEKCGVADVSGAWLIEPVFDQIYLGSDDRAVVIRGERFGIVHFDGEAGA